MSLENLYTMPGHLLRRCQQIAIAIFLEECKSLDIRPVDFAVLSALETVTDIDQVTLSGLIAVDRSSIARIVENLARKGLIVRQVGANDRRSKCLRITKKGTLLLGKAFPALQRVQERILEPLTKVQQKQFLDCLKKITHLSNEASRAPIRTATTK